MFQHCWMPIETWAALISSYDMPPSSLLLDGNKLLSAMMQTNWFNMALSASGIIDNDLSLNRNRYHQQGGKQIISCFYEALKGVNPIAKEKSWFNYIDHAEELRILKLQEVTQRY
jgi:hypothetical protein